MATRKGLDRQPGSSFARFLLAGALNTALTYAIYLVLLVIATYQVSYTVAYVLGIAIAYLLNKFFVFNSDRGVRSVVFFPLVYLAQYVVGIAVLWLWVEWLRLPETLAPLVAIVATIPVTYLLSRLVFLKT